MSNNKQSSVEWLYNKMYEHRGNITIEEFQQAKAMHKEEIETAFDKGADIGFDVGSNHDWHEGHDRGYQYYNETFNK